MSEQNCTFASVVLNTQLQIIFCQFFQLQPHGESPGVRIDQCGIYALAVDEAQCAEVAVQGMADEDGGRGEQTQQGYLHLQKIRKQR